MVRWVGRRGGSAAAVVAALLVLPASALAAWTETATRANPGGSAATCLRAAGAGEVALTGPLRGNLLAMDLVTPAPAGFSGSGRATLPLGAACPETAVGAD